MANPVGFEHEGPLTKANAIVTGPIYEKLSTKKSVNFIIFYPFCRNTWVLGYNMGKADLTNLFIEGLVRNKDKRFMIDVCIKTQFRGND